jgi:Xaa-Pro aminopeptidase
MDYPLQRRQQLVCKLTEEGVDALLLSNPLNVTYLTGFSGEASYLTLLRDRCLLVSDARFTEQLAEECPGLETVIRPPAQTLYAAVAEALVKLGVRSVGFESSHLTVAEWETLRDGAKTIDWKPGRDRVEKLRVVKDASEVAEIREAIDLAERAFSVFCTLLRPSDREKELADFLESTIRRLGGAGTSFPSIVAVGDRAALPHAPPTERAVADGDLVLVDWGASGRFYKSDLTRTFATRTISPKLEAVYAVVAKAQQQAIARIRPGVKGNEVDAEARAVIAEAGFGDLSHGLGHGIGLQVHEAPALRPKSEAVLQPGMVMTVEPGIYIPGWGGVRIEDDVLVTPDGCEVLTHVGRDLVAVFGAPR